VPLTSCATRQRIACIRRRYEKLCDCVAELLQYRHRERGVPYRAIDHDGAHFAWCVWCATNQYMRVLQAERQVLESTDLQGGGNHGKLRFTDVRFIAQDGAVR